MFDWTPPTFAHLPLLTNLDRTKLSKRQNDASVGWYRQQGYESNAMINYVAFLGWTPIGSSASEFLNMTQLINHVILYWYSLKYNSDVMIYEQFELERVHKASAVVSIDKLIWFNEHNIRIDIQNEPDKVIHRVRELLAQHPSLKQEHDDTYLHHVILCLEVIFLSSIFMCVVMY